MSLPSSHLLRRTPFQLAALALAYFVAAEVGLQLSFVHGNVTPVFPAAGVGVAALVVGGCRLWPGIYVGALAAHLLTDVPIAVAFVMSVGAPAAAVAAASLLRLPILRFRSRLDDVRSAVTFVGIGVLLPAFLAATWGVSTLVAGDVVPRSAFGTSWWTWCVGDALGAVVAGSALLAWQPGPSVREPHVRELAALCLAAVVAAGLLFSLANDGEVLLLPLLVVLAVRLEPRWALSVVLSVALLAAQATASGRGPFAEADEHASLVNLSIFLAAGTLTALVLGAAVAERDRAHRRLARANDGLEARVAERTRELATSEASLQAVVEHITDAVAILGADGVVAFANPAAEVLLGVHRQSRFVEGLVGRVGRGDDELHEILSSWLTEPGLGRLAQFELTLADGSVRHIEAVGENLLGDPLLGGVVVTARDVTGHELRARTLWEQARRDSLTGLPNRRRFMEELAVALERAQPIAVLFVDLDGLKQVNDEFGHVGGDALLVSVGDRLQSVLRSGDLAARLAGDEFTVLAYGIRSRTDAVTAGGRMLAALSEPFEVDGSPVSVSASIGVAIAADAGPDVGPEDLVRLADGAMYAAKRAGGGRVVVDQVSASA